MSSTYFDINTYDKRQSFINRLNHNCRKKNIDNSIGEYKNIIFKNDRTLLKNKKIEESINMSRTEISQKIANYRYKLKKVKKESTKFKYENYIKELEQLRDNTISLNKVSKPKKKYVELTFSITDLSTRKDLLRNQEYLTDLNSMLNEYVKDKFPNMDIIAIAGHLDQSTPHIHLNGMYIGDNNLNKDLGLNFGGKRHYKSLQRDFNKFIKEHELTKKHNLEINSLNNVSKEYLKLKDFKSMQARCKQQAKKIVDAYKEKAIEDNLTFNIFKNDFQAVSEVLAKKLEAYYYRDLVNKHTPTTASKVIDSKDKKIEDLEFDISRKSNDIRNLENNIIKLKDNLNKKIDKDALDKHVNQLVDNRTIEISNEISSKESKIKELKEDLATKTNELDAYKKAYNDYREYEVDVKEFIKENNLEHEFTKFMRRDNDYNLNR